ncbi:MAG TPA: hypothetical protein VK772_01930 [Puia sp.]|jgi:hypothetical protein|nr:hypothetical protein [Puia sp.]
MGLLFFDYCPTFEFAFNCFTCFKALDKDISDRCTTISLPREASSSNDILKFFPDFIGDHSDNNKKNSLYQKAPENQGLQICGGEENRTVFEKPHP